MSGFAAHRPLPAQVEEGLCQLMALLWLEAQQGSYRDEWEERLAAYLGNQIRTDQVGGRRARVTISIPDVLCGPQALETPA